MYLQPQVQLPVSSYCHDHIHIMTSDASKNDHDQTAVNDEQMVLLTLYIAVLIPYSSGQ